PLTAPAKPSTGNGGESGFPRGTSWMLGELVAPRFLLLYAYVAAAAYVHLRGRVRHRLQRQLTHPSNVVAPVHALIYAAPAVPRSPLLDPRAFPEVAVLRDHWREMRA